MTGMENKGNSLRLYSQDSKLANGEVVIAKEAIGKPLRIVDADGREVGQARFDAPLPPKWMKCTARGDHTESVECPSCDGSVSIKLFTCTVHGKCHLSGKPIDGAKMCRGCADAIE